LLGNNRRKYSDKEYSSMSETTIFIKEATGEKQIQQIEQLINQMEGVERVLVDTDDGELKIEFDDRKVSKDEILSALEQNNYHQEFKQN
jgi:copper chaperone CopZ